MTSRLALFAEVVLTGVLALLGGLVVLTVPAALAAGVAHLRRHVHGSPTTLRQFARDWLRAIPATLPLAIGLVLIGALVTINFDIAGTGALPSADLVRVVSLSLLVVAVTVTVRAAGCWSDEEGVGRDLGAVALTRAAWRRTAGDPSGSLLVTVATAAAALLPVLVQPLVVVVGGLVCMAVVAVDVQAAMRN